MPQARAADLLDVVLDKLQQPGQGGLVGGTYRKILGDFENLLRVSRNNAAELWAGMLVLEQ